MQIASSVQGLPEFIDIQSRLPSSVRQEMVFVKDATGREYKLLIDQCRSPEVSCVRRTLRVHGTQVDSF